MRRKSRHPCYKPLRNWFKSNQKSLKQSCKCLVLIKKRNTFASQFVKVYLNRYKTKASNFYAYY